MSQKTLGTLMKVGLLIYTQWKNIGISLKYFQFVRIIRDRHFVLERLGPKGGSIEYRNETV